jgi:hypothetical protein
MVTRADTSQIDRSTDSQYENKGLKMAYINICMFKGMLLLYGYSSILGRMGCFGDAQTGVKKAAMGG